MPEWQLGKEKELGFCEVQRHITYFLLTFNAVFGVKLCCENGVYSSFYNLTACSNLYSGVCYMDECIG